MKLSLVVTALLFTIVIGLQPVQARPISRSEVREMLKKGLLKPDSATSTKGLNLHMSFPKNPKPFTPATNYMSLTGYWYLRLLQEW